jgi:amidohydrolase
MTAVAESLDDKALVDRHVAAELESLIALSEDIHSHPELLFEEYHAAAAISDLLEARGFRVERGSGGLATAFTAEIGEGELCVGLGTEYDALPELGHACGHNLIATMGVGAALALLPLADSLGMRVRVIGCPAEEGGAGKVLLARAGVFDDVHAYLQIHPANRDELFPRTLANHGLVARFHGHPAHASSFPERGRNALDAITIAQVGIGLLRQQLPSDVRVHSIVTGGGDAVNIIPAETELRLLVRAPDCELLESVLERVQACLAAGALASGCELELSDASIRCANIRYDSLLGALFARNCGRFAGHELPGVAAAGVTHVPATGRAASTDVGNLSWLVPTIQPMLRIETHGAGNHEPGFVEASRSPSSHDAIRDGAAALAKTALDLRAHAREYLALAEPAARAERLALAARWGVV